MYNGAFQQSPIIILQNYNLTSSLPRVSVYAASECVHDVCLSNNNNGPQNGEHCLVHTHTC